ncbi:MAG: shikimate kinase [Prosthecochloris sp.]|uniref:Shikimate kinase n=1 Tax=Prosthecochloris aestuarii (strain DSM 271 / SK 413) TaxID=290512 RepID=AROK_PROA2|nr:MULTISPECIES: shikimate kinase [Prosthecochloris]B4S8Z9.1 RecName: Full=Shikimate kinase; Short=SK [Prosthecochloris aestuarii DSM 271]ACF46536.1 Shikimate kinase [Prosthecochloris aestuarii DSM 271]MCW8798079.1 shikimate kinase [Prosthecochloris sp.]NEX12647.1 shikimate kinase [Prosthecochloris sp.]RDD29956.1 shikimate kinase [Prosthecochloris sp. ZM]
MKQPSLIYLTGFSGSGKSTIGPLLANSLGYDFVDLDQQIEHLAGKTINRIFTEEGEAHFRDLELMVLQNYSGKSELVVSLGGGLLQNDRCFSLIISTGTLVYLHSNPLVLAKRLSHKSDRPLMKGEDGQRLSRDAIEQKILNMLEQREPRYKTAQITVETDTKRIGTTVEELTRKIERYIRRCEKKQLERNTKQRKQ